MRQGGRMLMQFTAGWLLIWSCEEFPVSVLPRKSFPTLESLQDGGVCELQEQDNTKSVIPVKFDRDVFESARSFHKSSEVSHPAITRL